MAIYEFSKNRIHPVPMTTFAEAQILERQHLQGALRETIEVVAPGTMVLAEEFSGWEDSRRRIDLLGLDSEANLVVIELKRDDDGTHMELQALRYASMVSTMTFSQAVAIHRQHLEKEGYDVDAESAILQHLGWDEPREEEFAQDVRIVLVAANFSTEITSTVLWLNDRDLDIRCVRAQPYRLGDHVLLDVQQIIPLPETASFQVQMKEKATEERTSSKRRDNTRYDVTIAGKAHPKQTKRDMAYLAVRAALEQGIPRDSLPVDPGKWLVVDGHISNRDDFIKRVREQHTRKRFDERRWFLDDTKLFRDSTSSFALSNQWSGHDALPLVAEIAKSHPELQISYKAVGKVGVIQRTTYTRRPSPYRRH